MLQFVDATLNQVALTVQPTVVFTRRFAGLVRRNDSDRWAQINLGDNRLRGIASVSNDVGAHQAFQQLSCLGAVMDLPARQQQAQGVAQSIDNQVDFGGETASTTPQRLCFLPAAFFVRLRHMDAHVRWCCPASRFPCPGHGRNAATYAPKHPPHTSVRNVCRPHSTSHIPRAAVATGHRYASPIALLPQTNGIPFRSRHRLAVLASEKRGFLSTGHWSASQVSSDQYTSNVNTT